MMNMMLLPRSVPFDSHRNKSPPTIHAQAQPDQPDPQARQRVAVKHTHARPDRQVHQGRQHERPEQQVKYRFHCLLFLAASDGHHARCRITLNQRYNPPGRLTADRILAIQQVKPLRL